MSNRKPATKSRANKATKAETRILIYPGIEIVAQPGADSGILNVIQSHVGELRLDFVEEQIAELLGKSDDRYEVARILRESPERIDQIAALVRESLVTTGGAS